jgi:transcriptional regulator with XRE-family HTH domain
MTSIRQTVKTEDSRGRKLLRDKLKQARKEADLSQAVVAYMLGCSQSYLTKVERTGRVDFARLERLAAIYDKPLEWFQTLDPKITTRVTWAPNEPAYQKLTRKEWKQAAEKKHWPVPRGWGNDWLRELFDYDLQNYKGSSQYARIASGEDFWTVFPGRAKDNKDFEEK